MKFLHTMLDSKSGLQMSINSHHYVKLIDTIILGIKRKQNLRQSIFLAKTEGQFLKNNCKHFKTKALMCVMKFCQKVSCLLRKWRSAFWDWNTEQSKPNYREGTDAQVQPLSMTELLLRLETCFVGYSVTYNSSVTLHVSLMIAAQIEKAIKPKRILLYLVL